MHLPLRNSLSPLRLVWGMLLALCCASPAKAQLVGAIGGISIDAQGLLREVRTLSEQDRLKLTQQEAVGRPGSEALRSRSSLRKVSLKKLERRVQSLHRAGKPLPADVEHLAGLLAVRYIVFDPAEKDVILLGPAEGWKQMATGEVVGTDTGRPVLHLDDLIAALRYAFDDRKSAPFIGCSIDPTAEGIKRYSAYVRRVGQMDRSRAKQIFAGMEHAMGPQAVQLFGVEPSSRFALAMLAADFRLKRIALGHDPAPVPEVTNYLDLAAKQFRPGPQKQHRWWFQAKYEAIRETPDRMAYELVGQGVEVVTAPAIAGQDKTNAQQNSSPAAEEFAESFTKHFTAISQKQPVFAELQNLIALATAAELIVEKQSPAGKHYSPKHFLNKTACPVREYHVPKHVPSIANYRVVRNRHWLISISGGVQISPDDLTQPQNRDTGPNQNLSEIQEQTLQGEEDSTWWSDERGPE